MSTAPRVDETALFLDLQPEVDGQEADVHEGGGYLQFFLQPAWISVRPAPSFAHLKNGLFLCIGQLHMHVILFCWPGPCVAACEPVIGVCHTARELCHNRLAGSIGARIQGWAVSWNAL